MPPRPDLPDALRRAANRRAADRRPPADDSKLVQAAKRGALTRNNTREGTRGRQAVDRATFLRRKQRHPLASAREALGHDLAHIREGRAISVLLDRPDPFVILEAPTRREASRAGRYEYLTGQLAAGRISPVEFRRRVSGWRPIRGERFLAEPDRVLAVLDARRAGEEELFVYRSGRAT